MAYTYMKRLKKILTGLLAALMMCCMLSTQAALAQADPEETKPVTDTHPDDPRAAFRLRGQMLTFEIDNEGHPLNWRKVQNLHLLKANGQRCRLYRSQVEQPLDTIMQTGDQLSVQNDISGSVYTVVVKGDPLSTGSIDVAQLVRAAMALQGTIALTDEELAAVDINNSLGADIVDLVSMARYLVQQSVSTGPFDDLPETVVRPRPSETPEPTESPEPDEPAEPSESPEPDDSAEPSESPEPDESAEPGESPEPHDSAEPTDTADPEPSGTAEPTETPEPSPSGTGMPTESAKPSESPVPSQSSSRTPEPSNTPEPAPTDSPEPSPSPDEPKPSSSQSAEPEPSPSPEPDSSLPPELSSAYWTGENADAFVAALQKQFRNMRYSGGAEDSSIDFSRDLEQEARTVLEGEHPRTPQELAGQQAETDENGIIRFVCAVYPDRLLQDGMRYVPLQDMVAAVTGPDAQTQSEAAGILWDTLIRAEKMSCGVAVSRLVPEEGEGRRETVYVAVALKPEGYEPYWNVSKVDALADAFRSELVRMRDEADSGSSSLEFDRELEARAAKVLAAAGGSDLDAQTGLADKDGIIDFVSAVDLSRLAPGGNPLLIPLSAVVQAVTGPEAHTNPPGKAVLWDTLRNAEYVSAGAAVVAESRGGRSGGPGTVYVAVSLRPDAREALWNLGDAEPLIEALKARTEALAPAYTGQRRTVRSDRGLMQKAAMQLNHLDFGKLPERLANQTGEIGPDGLVDFILPIYPRRLAENGNYNLITVADAALAAAGSPEERHLNTDGALLLFRILALSERADIGAAVSSLVPAAGRDGEDAVYLQVLVRPEITVPLWNEHDMTGFEAAVRRELDVHCQGLKDLEAVPDDLDGVRHPMGSVSLANPARRNFRGYLTMEEMVSEALTQVAVSAKATELENGSPVIQWDKLLKSGSQIALEAAMEGDSLTLTLYSVAPAA